MVVEKPVLVFEAQLADRDVTIELSDAPTASADRQRLRRGLWCSAVPRVIQEHIKKHARRRSAVRRLKTGGHVRVVVVIDEASNSKLSFDYPDVQRSPWQEKLPEPRRAKAKRRSTPRRPSGPRRNDTPPRGSSSRTCPPFVKV